MKPVRLPDKLIVCITLTIASLAPLYKKTFSAFADIASLFEMKSATEHETNGIPVELE